MAFSDSCEGGDDDNGNNDKNEGLSQNILCAKVEVIHDGGVQRGTDIAKALALGADGVDNFWIYCIHYIVCTRFFFFVVNLTTIL